MSQNNSLKNNNYISYLRNQAKSAGIARADMFLKSKAPNINLLSRLILDIIKDTKNRHNCLLLIATFTGINIRDLMLMFLGKSNEMFFLGHCDMIRVNVNCKMFASMNNLNINKNDKYGRDTYIHLSDIMKNMCSFVQKELSPLGKPSSSNEIDKLIKNELKMISSVLNEHKKKSEKEISHVNIRNMHKLFYHFFHITKNKTNTSILLLNHLSKSNEVKVAYTTTTKRLIYFELWMNEFWEILTKDKEIVKTYHFSQEYVGSVKITPDYEFKTFISILNSIKVKTKIEAFNLIMINIRYSLSISLATRLFSDSCNLSNYAEKFKILTIHEKTSDFSSGKCLKPLTTKASKLINLFYQLKKEINFDGFNPILIDSNGDSKTINKKNILIFLKKIVNEDKFTKISGYLKRSDFSLNSGRHIFGTESLKMGFNREYEYEFMSHYSNATVAQGILSNFDNPLYLKSTRRFMEEIEKKYLPDYMYPIKLINDFYKYKENITLIDNFTFKKYLENTKKSIIKYLEKEVNEENKNIKINVLEIIFSNLEEDRHYINKKICLDIQLWVNIGKKDFIKKNSLVINELIKELIKELFISKDSKFYPTNKSFFKTNPVRSVYLDMNLRKYEDIISLKYKFLEDFNTKKYDDITDQNLNKQINLFIYLKLFIVKVIDNYYLDFFKKKNFIYAGDKLILVVKKDIIDGFIPLDTVIFDSYTSNILKVILLDKGMDDCIFQEDINFYKKHLESFLKKENIQTKKIIKDAICQMHQFENTPLSLTLELWNTYPKICMQEIEKLFPKSVSNEFLEIENQNLVLYRKNKSKQDINKRNINLASDFEIYEQFKNIIFNLPKDKRQVSQYLTKCYNFIDNYSKLAVVGSIFTFTKAIIEKVDPSVSKKTIHIKTLLAYFQIYFDYCFDVILESKNKEDIDEISINIDIKLKSNTNNSVFNKYKIKIEKYFDYIKNPIHINRDSTRIFKRSVIFQEEVDDIISSLREIDGSYTSEMVKNRRIVFVIIAYFTGLRRSELRSRRVRDFYHIKNSNKFNIDVNKKGMEIINKYEKSTSNKLKSTNAKRAFEFEIPEKYLNIVTDYLYYLEKNNIEFLFPSLNANSSFSKKRAIELSNINSINKILRSITIRYCTIHSFRHGFITRELGKLLLKEKKSIDDIFNLIVIFGHSSFYTSLQNYAHLGLIKLLYI